MVTVFPREGSGRVTVCFTVSEETARRGPRRPEGGCGVQVQLSSGTNFSARAGHPASRHLWATLEEELSWAMH